MIQHYDRSNLASLVWPETPDGDYARRYLLPFIENDPTTYIANAHTQLQVLQSGGTVLPITLSEFHRENSYVCSPYSHYVSYGQEEFSTLKNPAFEACLRLLFIPIAYYFKQTHLDQVVYVNNWLVSTNLYPALPPELSPAIMRHLTEAFPDRAIIFRSVDGFANGPLLNELKQQGAHLIFSRSVWYQNPRSPLTTKRQHYKADLRLYRHTPYRVITADQLSPSDIPRIVQLYNCLYLDKYSKYNPQFTEAFIRLAIANNLLTLKAFQRDGQIDAVLGYFTRNAIGTPPIFGYDTTKPQSLGLYRLVGTQFSQEAAAHGFLANFSAGVGSFKKNRGCQNAIEYNAVFCGHLPKSRQRPWILLRTLMDRFAIPIIQKNGF
jgi:hypothetical protein